MCDFLINMTMSIEYVRSFVHFYAFIHFILLSFNKQYHKEKILSAWSTMDISFVT